LEICNFRHNQYYNIGLNLINIHIILNIDTLRYSESQQAIRQNMIGVKAKSKGFMWNKKQRREQDQTASGSTIDQDLMGRGAAGSILSFISCENCIIVKCELQLIISSLLYCTPILYRCTI